VNKIIVFCPNIIIITLYKRWSHGKATFLTTTGYFFLLNRFSALGIYHQTPLVWALKALMMIFALSATACQSSYPNAKPLGETFPTVEGTSLKGEKVRFPQDLKGEPVVLLLGYKQDAQFDIDRWFIGLDMTKTKVKAMELPTIKGMFPRMFKTMIDNGMRSGIPKELWGGVVTIYKDGDRLQKFTGNEKGLNARVMLLDSQGNIIYFHDRGFSVPALNELRSALEGSRVQ
jgi:hypothetical protein